MLSEGVKGMECGESTDDEEDDDEDDEEGELGGSWRAGEDESCGEDVGE